MGQILYNGQSWAVFRNWYGPMGLLHLSFSSDEPTDQIRAHSDAAAQWVSPSQIASSPQPERVRYRLLCSSPSLRQLCSPPPLNFLPFPIASLNLISRRRAGERQMLPRRPC